MCLKRINQTHRRQRICFIPPCWHIRVVPGQKSNLGSNVTNNIGFQTQLQDGRRSDVTDFSSEALNESGVITDSPLKFLAQGNDYFPLIATIDNNVFTITKTTKPL